MNDVDIVARAERIRDHRFTGYTNNMLADEIELFKTGRGIAGLSDAVAALKAVAQALSETDETLRTELAELGVEWSSVAGEQAASAVEREAEFSEEANEKVSSSAERIFAQGEAFNRTRHSLPEPQELRDSTEGYRISDFALSLIGFETDHVRKLERAVEAREQALQALNDYAKESGDNLLEAPELRAPDRFVAEISAPVPESIDAGGEPADTTAAASASGTAAPVASGAPPASGVSAQSGTGASGAVTPSSAAAPVTGAPLPGGTPPTSSGGRAVSPPVSGSQGTGSAFPSGATGSPSAPGAGAAGGVPGYVGGVRGPEDAGRSQRVPTGQQGSTGSVPPGSQDIRATGSDRLAKPPAGVGGGSAGPVGSTPNTGGVPGKPAPGGPEGTPPGKPAPGEPGEAGEALLGEGMSTGAVQPQSGSAPDGDIGAASGSEARGGPSLNDIGGGIAALGAGGIAGALSGGERSGRGVGRSAPGAARSPHPLSVGDLPEEEARVQRSSERLNPGGAGRRDAFLEKAMPGEEDDEHVRRFGVDDNDLFTDQRMVTPDVIGDDGSDGQ
ncbi:PPE domain-containing protein [Saccharomonospora sp.]|uniref:PPE domain-containing protein n=1 Tax=Saccharomonospora sp. TaxID=33913 RepID=UPI002605BE1E|nr:PPE domain-containing protein [Saccharomonospora sp.]